MDLDEAILNIDEAVSYYNEYCKTKDAKVDMSRVWEDVKESLNLDRVTTLYLLLIKDVIEYYLFEFPENSEEYENIRTSWNLIVTQNEKNEYV